MITVLTKEKLMKKSLSILLVFLTLGVYAQDLDKKEFSSMKDAISGKDASSMQWFDRFDISGFMAAGYYKTDIDVAQFSQGKFNIKEASLFFEATVWEDVSAYVEWMAVQLDHEQATVTGNAAVADQDAGQVAEVYINLQNVLKHVKDDLLGIKIGRMDIPFGDEYLWSDSTDNPLITHSVIWPYGWDEGIVFYGKYEGLNYVAGIMDGNSNRNTDDHASKSLSLKLYGDLGPLYLSGSYLDNGKTAQSELTYAWSRFTPVTGTTSTFVDAKAFDFNARYTFGSLGYLNLNYGQAYIEDFGNCCNDRRFKYFAAEPLFNVSDNFYLVLRYSTIGTNDHAKGYTFDGKPHANGNNLLGFNTRSLSRYAIGLGYHLNAMTKIKLEASKDKFQTIFFRNPEPTKGDRTAFYGLEVAVKF